MAIQVAETTKGKKKPKVLDHLRIHRALDGGHIVEHHYASMEHEPRTFKFGYGEMSRAHAHVVKHAGLSTASEAKEGDIEPADELTEKEMPIVER